MRRRAVLAAGGLWLIGSSRADGAEPAFRVVVHASNALRTAPDSWVADLFLKKVTRWPEGETVRAVDQRPTSDVRRAFSEAVLRRSVGAVRSYWQQRIFSGRDVPPPEVDSDDAVLGFVAKYPGAVGYVSGATKFAGVRELLLK